MTTDTSRWLYIGKRFHKLFKATAEAQFSDSESSESYRRPGGLLSWPSRDHYIDAALDGADRKISSLEWRLQDVERLLRDELGYRRNDDEE